MSHEKIYLIIIADSVNQAIEGGKVEFYSIVFDNSSGVKNVESDNFSIYPNPANQQFTINGNEHISSIKVFDITGKQVFYLTENINKQIDISNLQPGIYLIKANFGDDKVLTKRLIISK